MHADGYAGFEELYRSGRVHEVACMSHIRRKFVDVHASQGSAIAEERRGHALSARNDHWQGFPSANQPNNGADRDLPSQYRSGLAPRRPSC